MKHQALLRASTLRLREEKRQVTFRRIFLLMRSTMLRNIYSRNKTTVMNLLSLQEKRAYFCSQTENISKLALGFSDTTSGYPVPNSESRISLQICIHWERSPSSVLIHFMHSDISPMQTTKTPIPVGKESLHLTDFSGLFVVPNSRVVRDETETKHVPGSAGPRHTMPTAAVQ